MNDHLWYEHWYRADCRRMSFPTDTVSSHNNRSKRILGSTVILLLVPGWRCCAGFVGRSGSGVGRCSSRWPSNLAPSPLVNANQKRHTRNKLLLNISHDKSILLVENDDDLRKAIGKFLAKGGYHIIGVSDARSAMLVCRGIVRPVDSSRTRYKLDPNFTRQQPLGDHDNNSINSMSAIIPDCLVLDIQLGGSVDGLGLLRIIRSDPLIASLPVVLLTAKGKVEDRIIGYESDADAYLSKPFEPEELLSIIDGLLLREKFASSIIQQEDTITDAAYGDLRRELTEIKALLNLNDPSYNSLQRDISEIKEKLKDLVVDRSQQYAKPVQDQYDSLSILSPAETQIINLVAKGMTTKAIAGEMGCSISKIEKHMSSLLKKANVKNRVDLVRWWEVYSGNTEHGDPKVDTISSAQNADISTTLSAEERSLIELLEAGMTTEEIVSKTNSSKKRVALHLGSLFDKVGVKNRTQLVRWWRDGGTRGQIDTS